jgi:hypothetical protein
LQTAFFLVEQGLEDACAATEAAKYGAFTQTCAGSEAVHSDLCSAHFSHEFLSRAQQLAPVTCRVSTFTMRRWRGQRQLVHAGDFTGST